MRKYDVLFRVDAGPGIGLGHLRRCYALASALKSIRVRSVGFLTRRADLIKPWIDSRFGIEVIGQQGLGAEIKKCTEILSRIETKLLIVDHYDYLPSHIVDLKKHVESIACIDDNAKWSSYPVDVLINHNVYASELKYNLKETGKKLLGNKYALVVPEIVKQRKRLVTETKNESVYLTLGGNTSANSLNVIIESLNQIKDQIKDFKVTFVGSKLKKSDLKAYKGDISSVSNHKVAGAMKRSTFAISAGGITSYELACLGVPSLLFVKTKNQERLAKGMSQKNVAMHLGKLDKLKASVLTRKIMGLIQDGKKRKIMSRNGRKFIDGDGASRLAKKLKEYCL